MAKTATVHIFSIIPKISETFVKAFPNINIRTVVMKDDIMKKYEKKVTEEELRELEDARVLVTDGHLVHQMYDKLKHIEWIQCTWAGIEGVAAFFKDKPKPSCAVTRMGSPIFSQLMTEYVIGWILNLERAWLDARQYQLKSEWAHRDRIATYRSLKDLTVGIMGVGLIGREIAKGLRFFGCRVLGLGRRATQSPDLQVDAYFSKDSLPEFLSSCDYIVNVLPSTPDTRNLLGAGVLKHAKPSAVFVNIGRASIIEDQDIIEALDEGWISKAVLDVFREEPLPSSNPLWQHPKIIITPHAAGVTRACDVVDCFGINWERYCRGEPLLQQIDWERGY